jgi:hypothetical protein
MLGCFFSFGGGGGGGGGVDNRLAPENIKYNVMSGSLSYAR